MPFVCGFRRLIRFTTPAERNDAIVTMNGRATETDLGEIRRGAQTLKGPVALKLRGLDVYSPTCLRLLRAWLDAGVRLQDATPFLEMILKDTLA
jgi:hypothetical protein